MNPQEPSQADLLAALERVTRERDAYRTLLDHAPAGHGGSARLGTFDWDLRSGAVTWAPVIFELFEAEPDFDTSFESIFSRVYDEDKVRIMGLVQHAIASGEPIESDYRIRRLDGSEGVLFTRAVVLHDAGGQPARLLGMAQDVTGRKRIEAALQAANEELTSQAEELQSQQVELEVINRELSRRSSRAEEQLARLWEMSLDMLAIGTSDGFLRHTNPAFTRTLGWSEAELTSRPFVEFVVEEDKPATYQRIRGLQALQENERRFENRYRTKDGGFRWLSWQTVVVGQDMYSVARDITEQRKLGDLQARMARYGELRARVAGSLSAGRDETPILQGCCDAMLEHLDVGFAAVWLLDADERGLSMAGQAGLDPSGHGHLVHVAMGFGKVGQVASERKPNLTNTLLGDAQLGNPEWVRSKGLTAFAGFPLLVEGRLLGVLGTLSSHELPPDTIDALGLVADTLAQGIERLRAEHELQEQQQMRIAQLREVDRYKDEFLGVISHELRTPLNFITGFASTLQDEVHGPLTDEQQQAIAKILTGADRMLVLVDDLLDVARIQSGALRMTCEPTPLGPMLDEVVGALAGLAAQKGLVLRTELTTDAVPELDGSRIVQALTNLVANAIKFTDEGSVTLRVTREGEQLAFEVKDTGCGIAAEDLPKLFQRFRQLDMSRTRRAGGAGLGLSITKALVEAHGGHLEVQSVLGEGSTFRAWLPLRPTLRP